MPRRRHRQAFRFGQRVCASLLRGLRPFGRRFSPWYRGPERLRHRKAGSQAILVESISGPRAAEPGMAPALDFAEALLGGKGGGAILRMLDREPAEGERRIGLDRRVEADEQRLLVVDTLQRVHPVG